MNTSFEQVFGTKPEKKVSASGRINLIGEHVDYCGGPVFPAALNLKCYVYGRKNGTDKIRIALAGFEGFKEFDLNHLEDYKETKFYSYQAGCAYILQQSGYKIVGCDLYYDCQVPFGSGLSSSAAIENSTIIMLNELAGNSVSNFDTSLMAQRAEVEYCGMNCGIMDQFASAMGKKDCAILLHCDTLEYEYHPVLLDGYTIVVANSNKPHALTDGDYNSRRKEAEEATKILQKSADFKNLSELSVEKFNEISSVLDPVLYKRAKHVVVECERVKEAVVALDSGDIVKLGQLINASHESLSVLYEVTGRELDALAHIAQKQEGCLGSRMIGGGFGGCTISIVRNDCVEKFRENVNREYESVVGYKATFYNTSIEDGTSVEDLL
ncbi:MAG: galactokinase [Coprobacillus sp.]|nr:galactokinase [Coprobacillus sp.]